MDKITDNLFDIIFRFKWSIIATSLIIVLCAGYGATRLGFSMDNRVFFSPANVQLKTLEEFENTYNRENNILIVIEAKDGNIFTNETLNAIEEITKASWQIPYSGRVDSITNFQHTTVERDDLMVQDLISDSLSLRPTEIEKLKVVALKEPMLRDRLVSRKGHVTGIVVTINLPVSGDVTNEVASYTKNLINGFEAEYPDLNFYLTGGVIFDNALAEVSMRDMKTLMPIMFIVMAIVTYISLHSLSGTIATLIIITASSATAMGVAGWFEHKINSASGMAPIIILTLAVADSIHILSTIFSEMGSGRSKEEAIKKSLQINLQPIFLTSITTAIGFLSMNASDAPPFHHLGNIVALGVTAAFFYSIFLLPALISLMPIREKADTMHCICSHKFASSFAKFVIRRQTFLLYAMSVFIIITAFGITRIELDDNFIKYFDEKFSIRTDTDFLTNNLTGLQSMDFSIPSEEAGGISSPEYLRNLDDFTKWAEEQPNVMHVSSITEIYKRINRDMNGGNTEYYRVSDDRELNAQYLLLYELSLPYGLDLTNRINLNKSASRITITLSDASAKQQRELETNANRWIKENFPSYMHGKATGLWLMFAHISERNIKTMLVGTTLALVLISTILLFTFKSVKMGLISLLPNLAPAFMAFGLWGLFIGEVGLAVAVISALSLGIVVDDTVHFLSKYLRARREFGMNEKDAVEYSFVTVGSAITATSLILASGFAVLAFSGFGINSSMGLLTAIAVCFALMTDLLLLPPLLMKFTKRTPRT